jgi:hypothetical protein
LMQNDFPNGARCSKQQPERMAPWTGKRGAAPAPAPASPSKNAVSKDEAQSKISSYVAKKKAAAATSSSLATSPLLDVHGSFSRAALRTPLRLAFSSDTLTLDDLNRLLCGNGLCLSDSAASRIEEQVFSAYGSSFTIEQLVCLLVPVKRVMTYEELSEAEVALLRTKFGELAGKEGTIGALQLDRAAAELPGLHDGPLSADDRAAITARIQAEGDGLVDLETLFNVFREQQKATRPAATPQQLGKVFAAFERPSDEQPSGGAEASPGSVPKRTGVLPLERVRGVVKLFDGPPLKPDVLRLAKADVFGVGGDVSAKELAKQSKASQDIDVPMLIAAHEEQVQKAEAKEKEAADKAAAKAAKAAEKEDAHKSGGGGGFFGLFHKRGQTAAAAPAAAASPAEAAEAEKLVAETTAEVAAEKADATSTEPAEEAKGGWLGNLFGGGKQQQPPPSSPEKKAAPKEEAATGGEAAVQML